MGEGCPLPPPKLELTSANDIEHSNIMLMFVWSSQSWLMTFMPAYKLPPPMKGKNSE
jgi:hypothetical protein